ncbi:hypothetical protein C8J57DRAFT_1189758 [Mycena rebaudengoi]|nr:hypothetical protein C8J57DRAFT_1189758 [Mycena rebaudengoi]
MTENQKNIHALFQCIEQSNCSQNQTKVVIIESYRFIIPMERGGVPGRANLGGANSGEHIPTGEGIWAISTLRALENLGYTVLFAPNMQRAIQLYQIFDPLVKVVITESDKVDKCWDGNSPCIRTADYPSGIPAWKLFTFSFWWGPANPLGPKWTLSPEEYPASLTGNEPNTYLGYSIEAQCAMRPFIPHVRRNRQVYILGKYLSSFLAGQRDWPPDHFDAAASSTGVSFIAGAVQVEGGTADPSDFFSATTKNLGKLHPREFYDLLSRSIALVGMGQPILSPTPYDALCMGVPFINPIEEWDPNNPLDRSKWVTQHGMLHHLSAPHVYHVFKGDRESFVQAIEDAVDNPIQSYVLERMKMSSVEHRLGKILEHDWRAEAQVLLEQRKVSEQGPIFIL